MGGVRPARLLHTSDCHLGARPEGAEERAFVAFVELARRLEPDAVLLTGDLFDHARVPDDLLDWAADQVDRLPCPVVLLPGNHDALHDRSVHHRFQAGSRCREVQFLDEPEGACVTIPGTDVIVWGRAMIEHEPEFQPLAGLPGRPQGHWAVVAAHGLVVDRPQGPMGRSSPITDAELDGVDWDYVALGHVHEYREIRDGASPVRYCGATAASRRGLPGAVLVHLVPGSGAVPRWVPLVGDADGDGPGDGRDGDPSVPHPATS
jgi:DNA repair exonuclease SbcCD nuclease subunit